MPSYSTIHTPCSKSPISSGIPPAAAARCCCTVGPTARPAGARWRNAWPPKATGCCARRCAGSARPASWTPATPRSGELAALGRDLLDFIAALGLEQPLLVGHDWGARAAANACGLDAGVAARLVLLSVGYGTNDPAQALPLPQARSYWYHWFMATPRGAAAVRDDARGFTRYLWDTWSPPGWYTEQEFAEAAQAFDNPDWAAVVLHSYRHRWGLEAGDPAYAQDGARLTPAPRLAVPTLVLHGGADTCNQPATSEGKAHYFSGRYERRVLDGVGHFPQREAPQAVAAAILNFVAAPAAPG